MCWILKWKISYQTFSSKWAMFQVLPDKCSCGIKRIQKKNLNMSFLRRRSHSFFVFLLYTCNVSLKFFRASTTFPLFLCTFCVVTVDAATWTKSPFPKSIGIISNNKSKRKQWMCCVDFCADDLMTNLKCDTLNKKKKNQKCQPKKKKPI